MHLVRVTTLATLLTSTFALPSNPFVDGVNGLEKGINSGFDAATDYSSRNIAPNLAGADVYPIQFLSTLAATRLAELAMVSGTLLAVSTSGAIVSVTAPLLITILLNRDYIQRGSDVERIINLAQQRGFKVQIVPKSQRGPFPASDAKPWAAVKAQNGRSGMKDQVGVYYCASLQRYDLAQKKS